MFYSTKSNNKPNQPKNSISYSYYILVVILSLLFICQLSFANNLELIVTPQKLNPDGKWVTVIHLNMPNVPANFTTTTGELSVLPNWVTVNVDAAKIITITPTALTVTATLATSPYTVFTKIIPSPITQTSNPLQFVVTPVGPFLVTMGFVWLNINNAPAIQQFQISRTEIKTGKTTVLGTLKSINKTFQDDTVVPNTEYQYQIAAIANGKIIKTAKQAINTPPELPYKTDSTLKGIGMIIYIDPCDSNSPYYYKKLTPQFIINNSKNMNLKYIQLRTVYGSYSNFGSTNLKSWLNELLDLAEKNNIDVFSWSIPRSDKTAAIAEDIALAAYKSPAGNGFAGVSLDIETGPYYFSSVTNAKQDIIKYIKVFRIAVGDDYFMTAMTFNPSTQATEQTYPYLELAEVMDVLQPMIYWHFYYISANHVYTTQEVSSALTQGIKATWKAAQQPIPVNVIAQSTDLGGTGVPSAAEITTALQAAKNAGAIGVSFFDWNDALKSKNGKMSPQAEAIKNFKWN